MDDSYTNQQVAQWYYTCTCFNSKRSDGAVCRGIRESEKSIHEEYQSNGNLNGLSLPGITRVPIRAIKILEKILSAADPILFVEEEASRCSQTISHRFEQHRGGQVRSRRNLDHS
ncbi:MAG: hypothetical protein JSW08_00735 [archaeon]|nr:MAG: hypothetical protein JSW08_00735 [archaeon]